MTKTQTTRVLGPRGFTRVRVSQGPTKREVFYLNGVEIPRSQANAIACDMGKRDQWSFIRTVAFRDCGTRENPSMTDQGPMWREFV